MKKTLFMMLCSMLVWTSCKDGKQGGEAADAVADSLSTTERVDAAAEETEVSDNVSTIDVEKYWQRFQELYKEGDLDDIHYPLTKYAFIDIDGDGKDEVWVRTENDEDGALFFFDDEEEPQLIITETEGKRLSVAKGWVGTSRISKCMRTTNTICVTRKSQKLRQRKSRMKSSAWVKAMP